jgi:hypothetical protein
MKKICISLLVVTLACLSMQAQSFNVDGIQYKIISASEPRTVEVTSKMPRYEGNIVVPSEIDYLGNTYEVVRIGTSAFDRNYNLISVTVPNTVTSFGSYAFTLSALLETVNFPPLLKTIEDYAFEGCSSLTGIVLPSTVTSIGSNAFKDCSSLVSISVPAAVTSIGSGAFMNCSSMTSIDVESTNAVYASSGGVLYDKDKKKLICCPAGKNSVSVEGSVREIVFYSFSGCSLLNSISIPDEVTRIGFGAFSGCSGLSYIQLPGMLEDIEGGSFDGCTALTNITIPASVMNVQSMAFTGCSGLTDIYVDMMNFNYESFGGVLFNSGMSTLVCCPPGRTSIYIPNSVNIIEPFACYGCSKLSSIDIPGSVMMIRNNAFDGCSGLVTIAIPNSVFQLEPMTLANCTGLTSATLPSSIDRIPGSTFYNCANLTSVVIPTSVKTIESNAFEKCEKLASIDIPSSVTRIESGVFRGCKALTSLVITGSVTYIGSELCTGCTSLTTINVAAENPNYSSFGGILFNKDQSTLMICPEGKTSASIPLTVTTIAPVSFFQCKGLSEIEIPSSVAVLGAYAFSDCTGLTSITCNIIVPPVITETVFRNVVKSIPLYVPEASVDDYIAADYWKDFTNILPIIDTDIDKETDLPPSIYPNPIYDIVNIDGLRSREIVNIYDIRGVRVLSVRASGDILTMDVSSLTAGMYVIEITGQNSRRLTFRVLKK